MDWQAFGTQAQALGASFVLCLILGIERHMHLKSAGMKTHVLVGVGSCLFTLVSAYGFQSAMTGGNAPVDPTRIAAQIVSGIGFLGAGLIFVNNDNVRGLTTAATIWLSAAIGMACGAHMVPIAFLALLIHLIVVFGVTRLTRFLPQADRDINTVIEYETGSGVMPQILQAAALHGFTSTLIKTSTIRDEPVRVLRVVMAFRGGSRLSRQDLTYAISQLEQVRDVENIEAASDE